MNQKNRITYRFDRNGQSINEEKRAADKHQEASTNNAFSQTTDSNNAIKSAKMNVIPLYPSSEQHSISEISPWNSPFQEDIGALEQLIRNTDTKPLPAVSIQTITQKKKAHSAKPVQIKAPFIQENNRDDNEADYFKQDDLQDPTHAYEEELVYDESKMNKIHYSSIKRTAGGPSWFNVFLSVAAALATGALFGYLLLSLFTGASIWPSGSSNNAESQPASGNTIIDDVQAGTNTNANANKDDEVTQPAANNHSSAEANSKIPTVSLSGLDHTYYLLQFGVFSNTVGRDAALAQLKGKGLAGAAITSAADYRVYAGMANDRSKAQLIRGLLPDLDLYIKEVAIASPPKMPFSGDQTVAQAFFERSGEIIQMLDELVLTQLEQPALSSLSEAAAATWQAEHQKWTEIATTMRIGIKDAEGKAYLDKVIQSIDTAAKSMLEYVKNPSRAHLWSTQTEVMKAVITQKEWFETISAL